MNTIKKEETPKVDPKQVLDAIVLLKNKEKQARKEQAEDKPSVNLESIVQKLVRGRKSK